MSTSEEKLLILKMLEEGKISSEDAVKLLEAIDTKQDFAQNQGYNKQQKNPNNYQDELNKLRNKLNDWKKDFKSSYKNYTQKDFDQTVDEFAVKAEKIGKNVAVTTFGLVDRMIDFVGSIVDTNSFNVFGSYKLIEKTFEAKATDGTDLFVEGINGHITVRKHLDDTIIIRSRVRSPLDSIDDILSFSDDGSKVRLSLNQSGIMSVSHEIFIPQVSFNNVRFETSNGKIYVEDCIADNFESFTKNGHIELMGVTGSAINLVTKNAKIQLSYVTGKNIDINTNNAVIDIKNVKSGLLKAYTTNGRINVENLLNHIDSEETNIELRNSNGSIKVNMNDMESKGYKIKARTTNSSVNILIPEMIYHNVNRFGVGSNQIEAESSDFENFAQKVRIDADTTNGHIEVVK